MRKKKEVGEVFHTFLRPICITYGNIEYNVYGYRAIDGEIISITATTNPNTPWTKAESYNNKDLVEVFRETFK